MTGKNSVNNKFNDADLPLALWYLLLETAGPFSMLKAVFIFNILVTPNVRMWI